MKILFCSDGSSQAEKAVRFGALIAAACQAESTILGIAEKTGDEEPVLEALRRGQDILKEHHLNAELITKAGRPVREIIKRTQKESYDLVVIGAERKGTHGPVSMSARAYKIIESVEPPVLVVIGDHPSLQRILLCTSGTDYADRVVKFAGEIARSGNAAVDLFHVMVGPPAMYVDLIKLEEDADRVLASRSRLGRTLRHQKEVLEQLRVPCKFQLRHGLVVAELVKELQRASYDLVVTGSSPSGDMLRKYVMGDITREIVDRAELSVLVMRTGPQQITRRFGDLVAHLFRRFRKTSEAGETKKPDQTTENK